METTSEARTARNLRPAEAASRLGVSVPTFFRWARERPDFPKGRRLSARVTVFAADELDAYVARQPLSREA